MKTSSFKSDSPRERGSATGRFINSESGECLRARLHSQALEDSRRRAPALARPQTRVLPPSPLPLLG